MKFYHFTKDYSFDYIDYKETVDWESILCPVYEGHQRAGDRIGALDFEIKGPIDRDFYWTFLSELVVTERFISLLREVGATGFAVKQAKLNDRAFDKEFFEFMPTGQAGLPENLVLSYTCEYCGLKKYREPSHGVEKFTPIRKIILDPVTWDGSDIFTVVGLTRFIIISEKVKDVITLHNLRGAVITMIDDFDQMLYPQ